tara:strand:- start:2735 stop:3673 length:939 start_codon:yes stop_codon:yes gene_type:complete
MKNNDTISIIIPTYKGEKSLSDLVEELVNVFNEYKIEIVIINDCSPDNLTHNICLELCSKFSDKITYLKLSKNFGEHNAIMAGLRNCEGDIAIIMDDNQIIPSEAVRLAEYTLKNKFDVVFCKYTEKKDSFLRNLMSKIANYSAEIFLKKPKDIYFSSFKAIKKDLINQITKYKGPFPYIDGLILSASNNLGSFEVTHSLRKKGQSSYTLGKLARHYANLITNFSTVPIHIFSIIGFFLTIVSFLFILSIIVEKILNPNLPLGYSTIISVIFFFSGVQMLFLGLIGEYVGKILKNVNKEEQYIINYIKKKNK